MIFPKYKIETYTGTTLDYTIIDEALNLKFKKNLSGEPGTFSFAVKGRQGLTKQFDDIVLGDKVKIYLGANSVPSNPNFVGSIENRVSFREKNTFVRQFTGTDQGAILKQRIKKQFNTLGTDAHIIVDAIADALDLAKDTDSDGSANLDIVTVQTDYNDLLKEISDYGASINKDFYVYDNAGAATLAWKTKPIRSAGVTAFTIGEDTRSYRLVDSLVDTVKNKYWVFGSTEKPTPNTSVCSDSQFEKTPTDFPVNHLDLTASTTHWTHDSLSDTETLTAYNDATRHNTVSGGKRIEVMETSAGAENEWMFINRALTEQTVTVKDAARLDFAAFNNAQHVEDVLTSFYLKLLAPDTSNYWYYVFDTPEFPKITAWTHCSTHLGASYQGAVGSKDVWYWGAGNPDWYNIQGVSWFAQWTTTVGHIIGLDLDCIYFSGLRWFATDSDGASPYTERDIITTDDKIHSVAEATKYVAFLKAKLKDAAKQLTVTTPLDMNILLGDRCPVTIADENLSATNFDVISFEHFLNAEDQTCQTTTELTSMERCREVLPTINPTGHMLHKLQQTVRQVANQRYTSK